MGAIEPTTVGIAKGVGPFRGERARGLAPSAGVSEGGFRLELTTECGSTPTARSKEDVKRYSLNVKRTDCRRLSHQSINEERFTINEKRPRSSVGRARPW
ncbi:hypothetical protein NITMOv2_1188 [Nitrospira moscoviensis]|uniref:Uncharacterized protein n=1 Tax=Nitrospira moscoviensis TaxID=42253 RepID=A0A0K2GAI6_NITMO|nr:hypothetical protein NITMOv2_1188 [Nitrospira moscoviensis]